MLGRGLYRWLRRLVRELVRGLFRRGYTVHYIESLERD
nr:MAG TPA: hypothetical protein [Caudoviricetes sp.]